MASQPWSELVEPRLSGAAPSAQNRAVGSAYVWRTMDSLRLWTCFTLLATATLSIWCRSEWVLRCAQAGMMTMVAVEPRLPAGTRGRFSLLLLAAAAVVGLAQLGLGRTASASATVEECLYWVTLAAMYCLLAPLEASRRHLSNALLATGVFSLLLCAAGTLQFFTSEGQIFWNWPSGEPGVFGPFHSRNNYASFALLAFPIAAWLGIEKARINWGWLSGAALIAASVFTSGSRAGSALMLIELPVFLLLVRPRTKGRFLLVAAGLVVLVGGFLVSTGWDLLANKLLDDDPLRFRREIIGSAISMAKDKPLGGHGLGSFSSVYPAYARFDSGHLVNHAHNDWAEWVAEGGFPYAVLLLMLALVTLRGIPEAPWSLGLAAVYMHALIDYPMQRLGLAGWVIFIAALQSTAIAAPWARSSTRLPDLGPAESSRMP